MVFLMLNNGHILAKRVLLYRDLYFASYALKFLGVHPTYETVLKIRFERRFVLKTEIVENYKECIHS